MNRPRKYYCARFTMGGGAPVLKTTDKPVTVLEFLMLLNQWNTNSMGWHYYAPETELV